MVIERVEANLREIYGGRPWLVASDTLPAAAGSVSRLRAYGAARCFAIAARAGTGEPPTPEDCEYRVLGLPPMPMMEAILAAEEALRALPPEIQGEVDQFDPERRMAAIGAIFSDGRPVAGRPFWGARRAAWRALEDKTTVDALWDEAGVERVPSEVVQLEARALAEARARLDLGEGTVWAGDAEQGFHGGATYTCRVRTDDEARAALVHLASRCRKARVMPFLEGIPCSIHGMVFAPSDPVLVLRPAEMLTLRRDVGPTGFLYARVATFWDPPVAVREQMRAVARRVGEHLCARVAYRGAFTVDGVCTASGFRPTELNPRVGAALGLMVPGFSFSLLHDAVVEGVPSLLQQRRWAVDDLERELLALADHTRRGAIGFLTERVFPEPLHRSLSWTGSDWVEASDLSSADGELQAGPGAAGGFVQIKLVPSAPGSGRLPVGPSVGPLAAAAVAWADRELGTGIGPVEPARDVSVR